MRFDFSFASKDVKNHLFTTLFMCLCNIQLEQIVHSIPHIFPDYFFWPPSTENLPIIYLLISNHWSLSLTSLTPWVWPCDGSMWGPHVTWSDHYPSLSQFLGQGGITGAGAGSGSGASHPSLCQGWVLSPSQSPASCKYFQFTNLLRDKQKQEQ